MAEFIFGTTVGMEKARLSLESALHSDLPVLIQGECGTGKEIVARYLHVRSSRAPGPFVRVSCGALSGELGEGLFRRTQLDGNRDTRLGSGGLAIRGTLFLDELADMDLSLRLRVLEELESRRNASQVSEGSARVVCATSVNLEDAASEKRELESLAGGFVHRVKLLPLRERKGDLPRLCEYLLEKIAVGFGRPAPRLSPRVLEVLEQWHWPGNIRELENWMARIVVFGTEEAIGAEFNREKGRSPMITRRHSLRVNLTRFRAHRRRN